MHLVAVFAPRPLRERLMVLIAFDIELAKAGRRASDPVISRMRLQWWRDVIEDASAGATPRDHEVAGPLASLIARFGMVSEPLQRMVSGYETELDAPFSRERFETWINQRFHGLMSAAAVLAGSDHSGAIRTGARAMGLAFAIRNARSMAGQGIYLLPFAGLDRASLARAETTDSMRAALTDLVGDTRGIPGIDRKLVPAALKPVLRLGWRAGAVLDQALSPGFEFRDLRLPEPGSGAVRLAVLTAAGGF